MTLRALNQAETRAELIDLKYHRVSDAVRELGRVASIRSAFVGFQQKLYAR